MKTQLLQYLQKHIPKHRAESRIKTDKDGHLVGAFKADRWGEMWSTLRKEFVSELPQNTNSQRSKTNILVIGPGFGFKANPGQHECLTRVGFNVFPIFVDNPESTGFDMKTDLENNTKEIVKAISKLSIHVVVCEIYCLNIMSQVYILTRTVKLLRRPI